VSAAPITYGAVLTGPAESPPVPSPGIGFARVDLDTVAHTIRVRVDFKDLVSPTTVAHIHACTTNPLAGTVGVATQQPTFPGFPAGVTSGSYDQTFSTSLTSTFSAGFLAGSGGTAAGAEARLAQCLADGKAYLNVHTSMFPSGEIRGFLIVGAAPTPGSIHRPAPVNMSKSCVAASGDTFIPAGSVPPGTLLNCQTTFNLGTERDDLTVTDIISGGGNANNTSIVGSAMTLVAPGINTNINCDLSNNQFNRVEYSCPIGDLDPGTYTLTYQLQASNLGCNRSTSNSASLNQTGVAGHLAVASTSIGINCNAVPSI
jgi:hypothetical protein